MKIQNLARVVKWCNNGDTTSFSSLYLRPPFYDSITVIKSMAVISDEATDQKSKLTLIQEKTTSSRKRCWRVLCWLVILILNIAGNNLPLITKFIKYLIKKQYMILRNLFYNKFGIHEGGLNHC